MQATIHLTPPSPLALVTPTTTTKSLALPCRSIPRLQSSRCPPIRATSTSSSDPSTVDYTSMTSVFPAEACETIGGEACDAEMYPEVKLKPEGRNSGTARTGSEQQQQLDRDYLEYDNPKTVFPGEACDDLGGEFCEPEYQTGVY